MHLKSIELQEVGTFSGPVRLNNLSGGLNVLSGRNELGKSTLLRGLLSLFLSAHRSTKREIKDLRPYRGGAPRISCCFELDGHDWLLEKQFLASAKASLRRADGRETYPGVDAESHLEDLFRAAPLAENLNLLWAQQGGQSLEVPKLGDETRQSIGRLLSVEVEAASGLGLALSTLKSINDELGELVTKTDKPKKGGAYDKLLTEHAKVQQDLANAQQIRTEAEARLHELNELQQEEAELTDATTNSQLDREIAELSQRHAEAGKVERQLVQLTDRIQLLENQKKNSERALQAFNQERDDLKGLDIAINATEPKLRDMEANSAVLRSQMAELVKSIELAQASLRERQQKRESIHQARIAAEQRTRLATLLEQQAQITGLENEVAVFSRRLEELSWPDGTLEQLRGAIRDQQRLEDRLNAEAPRLTFDYAEGVSAGFTVAGEPVTGGAKLIADKTVIVEVAGVGKITISPGVSETATKLTENSAAAASRISHLLKILDAEDIAIAEARDLERRDLVSRQQILVAKRNGIAPAGKDILANEIIELQTLVDRNNEPAETSATETIEDMDQLLEASAAQLAELRKAYEELGQRQAAHDQDHVKLRTQYQERCERRGHLAAKLDEHKSDMNANLMKDVARSQTVLNEAVREKIALSEVAITTKAMTELVEAVTAKRATKDNRETRLSSVRQQMRMLEGQLHRDFADGTADQVGSFSERALELEEQLQETQSHIAALKLLSAEISAEIAAQRQQIAKPLAGRMMAFASRLWPTVELGLSANLDVTAVSRSGQEEAVDLVSAGTREQIALLARLAYAGIIAESPIPLPVILDDPLVFSDDERLEALFDVLTDAAKSHQIIILTCHERAFQPLLKRPGVTQVSLLGSTSSE